MLGSFAATVLLAQTPGASPNQGNSIEGKVINDRTGLPLRDARVVLQPEKGGAGIGVDTDESGTFAIRNVEAGRYSLSAARDGFLPSSACLMGSLRLPPIFYIGTKEAVSNLTFRLRPFAVITGKISLDDGEPAMSIRVEAYRKFWDHVRHGYKLAASAVTNDRGEYRMFGLQPGSYFVAATVVRAQAGNDPVAENRSTRYATTFYPDSTRLGEAAPVRLEYGVEVGGIDVSLKRVRKVTLHGRIVSGTTGAPVSSASIAMQMLDAQNTASIAVNMPVTFDREHRFEIRDVVPGPYVMWAETADGGKALEGHAPLTVGEADIDNVELTVQGERPGSAVLVVAGNVRLDDPVRLRFEPRNERGKVVESTKVASVAGFHFSLMGDDRYDLFVTGLPNDFYMAGVRVNGVDAITTGIDGGSASLSQPFEIVIDANGGRISGRVIGPDDSAWSRAKVALIPDPPAGRAQSYREGATDENGLFTLRGIAPGQYILIAWMEDPPCELYDPDGMAVCRSLGISVESHDAREQNVELKMNAAPKR